MYRTIAIGAGLLSLCLVGFIIAVMVTGSNPISIGGSSTPRAAETSGGSVAQAWVAAAPGRVEPRSGLIRLGTSVPGRVDAVPVNMNDKVADGEVLVRIDDKEARARLSAAEADAARRKRERDAVPITAGRDSVSKAEDAVFTAERAVTSARFELDDAITANRKNANPNTLANARRRLADANDRLRQEQSAFAQAQNKSGVPLPNALEAALIAARSDVTLAETVLDKTRVRAPIAGTVLQINAKVGELVAPSPELPLIVMGDMSIVRVRAEVDEADVSKIKKDQRVYVKNTAHPGKEFEGKVVELAPSLALPRMGSRGARRTTDVEVMEVLIDLDGSTPLLPGMRADVFFRR
ncbi:MAG TPA: HlyD family efflux transporter periplasmic adaptor subunit [Dongiaceae bacterium]|nr:HlyD family efflux transporter periplasmic adaptor subunit [Dongiaceae bacterium]